MSELYKPILDLNQSDSSYNLLNGRINNPDIKQDITGIEGVGKYQALLLDPTVQAAFNKVVQDILSSDWTIIPNKNEPEEIECANFIKENLERVNLQHASRSLLQAYLTGQQIVEPMWKRESKLVIVTDLVSRDPRRLIWTVNDQDQYEPRILSRDNLGRGKEIPPRKIIIHRYWLLYSDNPYGWGLGSILHSLVCAKNKAIEYQRDYSRRHSTPLGIAKVPVNMPQEDVDRILSLLANLGERKALVLPQGVDIDFLQSSGDTASIEYLVDYYTREINLLISTEVEVGQPTSNRASSEVANELRLVKSKELADELDTVLNNTLIRWLTELNFPNIKIPPKLSRQFNKTIDNYKPEIFDLVSLKDNFELSPTKNYFEKTYGIEFEDSPPVDKFASRFLA